MRYMRHTPGPWKNAMGVIYAEITTVSGETIYPTIAIVDPRTTAAMENATLIAAAEEMLHFVERISHTNCQCELLGSTCLSCEAASLVSKATEEGDNQ